MATQELMYQYLERRPDSWRRQLFVKGFNIPAGYVVRDMLASRRTPRQHAESIDLPVEAVYECLRYYDNHEADVLADIQIEREDASQAGITNGQAEHGRGQGLASDAQPTGKGSKKGGG